MNHDEHLDNLLDEALSEYREAEPLAGMEGRVLQRLQSQRVEHRPAWRMWRAIVAFAVLVLIGVWLGVKNPTSPREGGVEHAAGLKPRLAPKEGANLGHSHTAVSSPESKEFARVTNRPTWAKEGRMRHSAKDSVAPIAATETAVRTSPSVFPLPTPLTAEERAFVAALQKGTDAMPGGSEADITIAEIEIKPLAIGGISPAANLSSGNPGEKQ